MLVLTRKEKESIWINGNIEINIVEIGEGKVKLGINAPKSVSIVRAEIKEAVEKENKQAVKDINLDTVKKLYKK